DLYFPVTRSTRNELHRISLRSGLCRRLAFTYSARGRGMGCLSWLVESQRFPASLHGIYNRRCYLLAPRCFRINRRPAASDGKTNSAYPARRARSYGRSLRRLPLCGKQSTVSHRRIRRLRNPAPFGRRVAYQRHFCRFARRLGRDRTRLFLRFMLTPAASRATECDRGAVSQRFSVAESGRSNGSVKEFRFDPVFFPQIWEYVGAHF